MASTTNASEGTSDDVRTIMCALGLEASANHPQSQTSFSVDKIPRGEFTNPPLLLAISVGKTFKFERDDEKLWPVALGCATLDTAMISEHAPGKDGSGWAEMVKGEVYTIAGRQDSLYADIISAGCEPSEKKELSIRQFGKWLVTGIIGGDQKPRHTVIICENITELQELEEELGSTLCERRFSKMPGTVKVIDITDLYKAVWPGKPVQSISDMIDDVDASGLAALEAKSSAMVTLELALRLAVTVAQRRLPAPTRKPVGIMASVLRSIGGAFTGRLHAPGAQEALAYSPKQAALAAISDCARTSIPEPKAKIPGAPVAQQTTTSAAIASQADAQNTQIPTSTAGNAIRAPAVAAARVVNPAGVPAAPPAAKVSLPSTIQTHPTPQRTPQAAESVPQSRPTTTSTPETKAHSSVLPVNNSTTASHVSSAPAFIATRPTVPTQTVAVNPRITLLAPNLVFSTRARWPDPLPADYSCVQFTAEDRKTVVIGPTKIRELPKRIHQRVARYSEYRRAIELWLIDNARTLGFKISDVCHYYEHEYPSGDTEVRHGIEHNEGFKILGRFLAIKARIPSIVSKNLGGAARLRNFVSDWHENLQTYNKELDKWEDLPEAHEQVKLTESHRAFATMLGELAIILKDE
ncbi:hypothetical protein LTR17_016563 [Elasticomyces elasticus]|nr:hypothetical protein LTR17_016563 [Elasticomyces elasticus]